MASINSASKQGWLFIEEEMEGSILTWKKRWGALSPQKLLFYKTHIDIEHQEPISAVDIASIEELEFQELPSPDRFCFCCRTSQRRVNLACDDETEGKAWVDAIKLAVPMAKLDLVQTILLRKANLKGISSGSVPYVHTLRQKIPQLNLAEQLETQIEELRGHLEVIAKAMESLLSEEVSHTHFDSSKLLEDIHSAFVCSLVVAYRCQSNSSRQHLLQEIAGFIRVVDNVMIATDVSDQELQQCVQALQEHITRIQGITSEENMRLLQKKSTLDTFHQAVNNFFKVQFC